MLNEIEIDAVPDPAVFSLDSNRKLNVLNDTPIPAFPLIVVANFRSAFNKAQGINRMLEELGVEVLLGVETWERKNNRLTEIITSPGYKCHSIFRENKTG